MVENDILGTINKTVIKNFAIYSRNKLIQDIKNKAALIGITESGTQEPLSISRGNIQLFDIGMQEPSRIEGKAIDQRNALIQELKSRERDSAYELAYDALIEEVAFTWFNRIIAIRFMEVNNYMPDRMRVLSSGVEGINEPEFITHVLETSFEFTEEEKKRIIELKTDGSNLAMDELFQFLFVKQCNALNANLPELFEKTNDYSELLLNVSYNDVEGVIYKLIHDVPEKDFDVTSENGHGQVEIIGWMYQFYNTEPKAAVFSRPKSKKIEKQDIPAATQLFTPEWIVKYMVENSLGRLWIERLFANGDNRTEKQIADYFGWKYYLSGAEQEDSVEKQLEILRRERKEKSIEDITFLDPAMGSFHIGIYAFEVFMQLYESEGYTTREAAKLIVEKNLHGLDIDKRASQLSYFACMMQARKYNRRILEGDLQPKVYEISESNSINREHLNYLGNDKDDKEEWTRLKLQLVSLLNNLADAKEYGSLINISEKFDFPQLRNFVEFHPLDSQISLLETVGLEETQNQLLNIINVAEIISKNYDVVITNPPYMSSSGMSKKLADFAKKYYPNSKSDMFAIFIEKCKNYTERNGYFSMITQHAWMFLSSYEKLRSSLQKNTLVNMAHLGTRAFEEIGGEVVQTTSFVYLNNYFSSYTGKYIKLTEFDNQAKKEAAYLGLLNGWEKTYSYENNQENFKKIPGSPIAYWASNNIIEVFDTGNLLKNSVIPSVGIQTGDNDKFLRFWWEVEYSGIYFDAARKESTYQIKKWFPYNKGGEYRKWYGNDEIVIDWRNDGESIKQNSLKTGHHYQQYSDELKFQPMVTWSRISSGSPAFRFKGSGYLSDMAGFSLYSNSTDLNRIIAFCNSVVAKHYLSFLAPTLNFMIGPVVSMPFIVTEEDDVNINPIALKNISLSKVDWDSFEISWNFTRHPLVRSCSTVACAFSQWEDECINRFNQLKANEEELNRIFIDIYGLQNELVREVEDKDIIVRKSELYKLS